MGKSHKHGLSHAYDKAENKKSARESDVSKGHQSEHVSNIEHVGTHPGHHGNMGQGVRFKLPEDAAVTDHSRVTRSHLAE